MKRISVFIWCLLFLFGAINVSANGETNKKVDYNDPEFKATVDMLYMEGHGNDDYATCSVKQKYYKSVANMMFKKGMTKQQILDYYVKELGPQAVVAPPKNGFYLTLWVTPFLLIILVSLFIFFIMKKWKKNRGTEITEEDSKFEVDDVYSSIIEQERKRFI